VKRQGVNRGNGKQRRWHREEEGRHVVRRKESCAERGAHLGGGREEGSTRGEGGRGEGVRGRGRGREEEGEVGGKGEREEGRSKLEFKKG
jgi:hypothetical protein